MGAAAEVPATLGGTKAPLVAAAEGGSQAGSKTAIARPGAWGDASCSMTAAGVPGGIASWGPFAHQV